MRATLALLAAVCVVVTTLSAVTRSPVRAWPVQVVPVKFVKDQSRVEPAPDLGTIKLASLGPPPTVQQFEQTLDVLPPRPVLRAPVQAKPDTRLLAKARQYIGTNPTGWRSLWCAKFIAMLIPDVARKVPNPNLARSWAVLPKVKPAPGVIVVLTRGKSKNAGHIGVVKGFDKRGNPIVISGNHNRRVAESVYSKHRVVAYVSPNG